MSPDLDRTEIQELLLLIEKDVAHLYYCHRCGKLHSWKKPWFKHMMLEGMEFLGFEGKCHYTECFKSPSWCFVPYYAARLAMNRHLYGPAHGITLSRLRPDSFRYKSRLGVKFSETWDLRIVDDRLLMSSVVTMSSSNDNGRVIRQYIDDDSRHRICEHLSTDDDGLRSDPQRIPELATNCSSSNYIESCTQSVRSCTSCMTDYCIDIIWRNRERVWVIKIIAYHQLGACRSPWDWDWTVMASPRPNDRQVMDPVKYRPGIIRQTWHKSDGAMLDSKGEWAPGTGSPLLTCER